MPTSRRALAGGALSMHVAYFLAISCLGYGLLGVLKVREPGAAPRRIDRFFTAVSAATVSSMSTVEMEVFSNGQLVVLTVLMLLGGEVFVSLVGLASKWSKLRSDAMDRSRRVESHGDVALADIDGGDVENPTSSGEEAASRRRPMDADTLRHNAVRALFYIVLAIFAVVHVVGAVAVAAYVLASPGARRTLGDKSLNTWTFAVFTTVSTFSNCGFMPTNENMVVFKRDAPLQLLLVPQVLAGNTLFAPLLAACVWAAAAATRREELVEMAREGGRAAAAGYAHLMPARRCWMLAATVAAFVAVLMALVCGMEWGGALQGMSPWEKVVNALFLAVNARHTGESTVDLSILAPAILVLFVLMMYLPPYTTWFPFEENSTTKDSNAENQGIRLLESTLLSQLSYLTIFVIAICITERRKLKEDPLNFSVLSIVVEVVRQVRLNGFLPEKKNADQILKPRHKPTPRDLDLMFTSVSTAAVSSMATVEMEDFSNQQLWVLILLMILGGEVSISMLALHFNNAETNTNEVLPKRSPSTRRNIESFDAVNDSNQNSSQGFQSEATISLNWVQGSRTMKQKCRNMLAHIVTGYFIAAVVCSSLVIIIFAQIDSDTRQLLKSKDIKIWTFSIFTAVSSFANCGFTPVLAGNTILSPLLRLSIWILRKVSRREEYAYILQHPEDTGYRYYPSDNSALPINADNKPLTERGRNSNDQAIWKNFIISKSACLAIFTIIACITERKSISTDPLNFNIFSIAFKIISAYANVGYSLGYSCERLLKPDATCKATSYGFVGKWTDEAISTRAKTRAPRSGKCRAWKEGNYQEKRGCRGGRRRGRHGRALIGLVPVLGCAARRGAARRAEGDIVGGGKPSSHAPRQDRVQGDGHRARRRREERRRLPPPSSAVAADCSPSSGFPNDWA
nr:OSJNBa0060N03.4 [Oryza sativa Japonica Group]